MKKKLGVVWLGLFLLILVSSVHCQELDDDDDADPNHKDDDKHPGKDSSEEDDKGKDDDGNLHDIWPYIVGGVCGTLLLIIIGVVLAHHSYKKRTRAPASNVRTQETTFKTTKVAPEQALTGGQVPNAPTHKAVFGEALAYGEKGKANPVEVDDFVRPPDYCDLPPAYEAVHTEHELKDKQLGTQGVEL